MIDDVPTLLRARADSYWRDARTLAEMGDEQAALAYQAVADELRKIAAELSER